MSKKIRIGDRRGLAHRLPVAEPGGLDCRVDPPASGRAEEGQRERALRKGLAAAEGEPATRPRVEGFVFLDDSQYIVDAHPLA